MQGLQQFLAFAQTARRGSFAAAARDLGAAPSTLAKSVARLEAALGVKLFHRTTRQVSLTPDGERLYARCERVLAEFEALRDEAAGAREAVSGTLRVDLPVTYGRRVVLPRLAALLARHPALALDARLRDEHADLVREGLDAAVRIGALADSSLVARRIDRQELLLVASPAYLEARGAPASVDALDGHAAILFRMPGSGRLRPWQLRKGRRVVEWTPPSRLHLGDGEAVAAAACEGLGLAQLPDNIAGEALERGALVELLPAARPPALPIHVVLPSGRLLPPRVRALLDALAGVADRPR